MKKTILSTLMAAGALAFATSASAAPVGILFTDGGGQLVQVTANSIDWYPLGGGTGTIVAGVSTDVDYIGAGNTNLTLTGVTNGTINDLGPVPSANFMTFAGHPDLAFDLNALGPASANNCQTGGGGFVSSGSCSFTAFNSPFILTYVDANRTSVSLGVSGIARDWAGQSLWSGAFTTQVNKSIATIFNDIYGTGPGFVESSHSGEFVVQMVPVPEPASMLLLGLGFGAAAFGIRRRR